MKKIILLILICFGFGNAVKYEVVHLKRGGTLNIRDFPSVRDSLVVGKLAYYTSGIEIKECTELIDGSEWCYISLPKGGDHLEGWVNSYYIAPMSSKSKVSRVHIQNFLHNFYMADEEDFLDKLQSFYAFPMQKYLWSKNVSLMQLRSKKVRFYKKWSKRRYRLTYLKILKRKPDYVDVQTTVRWKLESSNDFEEGKDIQKLRLIPTGNTFKVSAIKYLKHTVYPKPVEVIDENLTDVLDENSTTFVSDNVVFNPMKYYIKAGSFFSDINSQYLTKITDNGFSYMIQKVYQGDKVIRRVFIGPFDSAMSATQSLVAVRENINAYAYIQKNID